VLDIGGKGGWKKALGTASAFQSVFSGKIRTTLILDRDYESDANHEKMIEEANKHFLSLKIWSLKEIESFFLVPTALYRVINGNGGAVLDLPACINMIGEEAEALKHDTIMSTADSIHAGDKKQTVKACVALAEKAIKTKLTSGLKLQDIVSGKQLISRLSARCKTEFDVSFGALSLCKALTASEIPSELKDLVSNLCASTPAS